MMLATSRVVHFRGRLVQQSRIFQQRSLTTSKQKRALNPDQIHGQTSKSADSSLPTSPPPSTPPMTTISGGSSDSSNNMIPFGIAGAVAIGGGAYYFMTNRNKEDAGSSSNDDDGKKSEAVLTVAAPKKTPTVQGSLINLPREQIPASTNITGSEDTPSSTSSEKQPETANGGHRVTSIAVPAKMKNMQAPGSSPALPVNPIDGNRVSTLMPTTRDDPKRSPEELKDATMTQQAIQELTPNHAEASTTESQESLIKSHQSLWSSLEATYFKDLDSLTRSQLQTRIVQLASELKDRTKWEAVRLKEFLAMKEQETANHYLSKLQTQRNEFETLLAQRLRELEHELQLKANAALQEKELAIQNLLQSALDAQKKENDEELKAQHELARLQITSQVQAEYDQQLETYKKQVARELEQKMSALQSLTQKLQKLESALQASGTFQKSSMQAHRLSAAALALAERLESHQPVATEIATLRSVAGEEGVIPTALHTIPDSAAVTGIPTLAELQLEFDTVYSKCRQAALVPKGRLGVEGQLAGMLFAKLKYAPNVDDAAPENADPDTTSEYLLVRAKKHVSLGQLEQAVDQLDQLTGQVAFTAKDWKQQAMDRIAVDKALRVIKWNVPCSMRVWQSKR